MKSGAAVQSGHHRRRQGAVTTALIDSLGKPLLDAALEGARLRLRPILMTSFAFIFGLLPLWFASGSGAVARRILGSTVIGGMMTASAIAIFLIPVMFYAVEKLAARRNLRPSRNRNQPCLQSRNKQRNQHWLPRFADSV